MTLKNNRAPFLSNIKGCASFHHHLWIQTGVTIWKWISWVLTSVTLELWPLTLTFCMVLTLAIGYDDGNIVKKAWQMDRQTNGQMVRRTENTIHKAVWSQLKTVLHKLPNHAMLESSLGEENWHFTMSLKTYNVFEYISRIITQNNNIESKEPIARKITNCPLWCYILEQIQYQDAVLPV